MNVRLPSTTVKKISWAIGLSIALAALGFSSQWIRATGTLVDGVLSYFRGGSEGDAEDGHNEDGLAPHDDGSTLELSLQAQRNIGLTKDKLRPVTLETFRRSVTMPAIVVEKSGRTHVVVATPLTGVITHVHAVKDEAVVTGSILFQIRLTHEDLVRAQTDFLKTIGELDVERREIVRLKTATASGAVARVKLLERQYAQDKLEALRSAQSESLRLHGLSERQVEQIATERRLLRELQIVVPTRDEHPKEEIRLTVKTASFEEPEHRHDHPAGNVPLVITELNVRKGQAVAAGMTLCVLSDMSQLYIEGMAFEEDAGLIERATASKWKVAAIRSTKKDESEIIPELPLEYVVNVVNTENRTLKFYVGLPNSVLGEETSADGQRFLGWRFRLGERMQLRVPVEEWPNRIVVPTDAIAREGADYFVFMQNGDHFDRRAVHVEYRDQFSVVIANDGSLFEGDVIATVGAHQMQMALKNKSGGPVDPHAGHNH
jgi:cobalt-zinc-cadmium efflux system membrane fusion protein